MTKELRSAGMHPSSQPAAGRYELLGFVLAAVTALITAAVQVSGQFDTAPTWVPASLYLLAAVIGIASALANRVADVRRANAKWAQQVGELLALNPSKGGRLPLLSGLSPYELGASPSRYGDDEHRGRDPYVPREVDAELDRALQEKPFVLLVGDSKAGKSRTAYEAARRLTHEGQPHDAGVLLPKNTAVLPRILDLDPPLGLRAPPALVWLDDLTEGELAGLTPGALDRLRDEKALVLGTITAQRHDRVRASDTEAGRSARLAIGRASVVRLGSTMTDVERGAAQTAYPAERFDAGIGEQLVAAEQLLERYDNARQGAEPHGWAVLQAAIDWVRMDVGRPVRRSELAALYPLYLALIRPTAEPLQDLSAPLTWACTALGSRIALLRPVPPDAGPAYLPFDYLVGVADGQDNRKPQPIPEPAWDRLTQLVTPAECERAARSALLRHLYSTAHNLFAFVAANGDSDSAPIGLMALGSLFGRLGDADRARLALQQAIDTGHPEHAPLAMIGLGELLEEQGDVDRARAAYQNAIETGHPDDAPLAMIVLGELLERQGDVDGARAAYQNAMETGHPDLAPSATVHLGNLLGGQGDLAGARAAYQAAVSTHHPDWAPKAMVGLGFVLDLRGDTNGARAAYRQAIESGHADMAPKAMTALGNLLARQGDLDGAQAAYQQAVDTGDADEAPSAMTAIGSLLAQRGDVDGARAAYEQAIATGDPGATSVARAGLQQLGKGHS